MDLASWKSQLMKGAAELAVLAVLEERELYGLEILETLSGRSGLSISEGSIYPLLNRLQREGKISSVWREDDGSSHPRKYYFLSGEGMELLAQMKKEWRRFCDDMDDVLGRRRA